MWCHGLCQAQSRAPAGLSGAGGDQSGGWEGGMGMRVLIDHKVCL